MSIEISSSEPPSPSPLPRQSSAESSTLYDSIEPDSINSNSSSLSASLSSPLIPNFISPSLASPPLLIPPSLFAFVHPGLYRSGFPRPVNFNFLRSLKLRSVVYLGLEDYPTEQLEFLNREGIELHKFPVKGNCEPFISTDSEQITRALEVILDTRNHPLLIHCNKGKHRTGCLVGLIRRLERISLTSIFSEYQIFLGNSSNSMNNRILDHLFIEMFDLSKIKIQSKWKPKWLQ